MCGILGRRNRKTSSGLTQCRIFQSYPLQNKDPSGLGIKVRLRDAHRLTLPKASSSWATFKWGFKPKRVLGRCQDGWRFVRASQCEVFCEFAFCCGRLPSKCQPGRTILTFITVPWIYNKHGVRAAGCSAGQGPHCILPPRSHRSLGDIWPWRLTWKGRLDALPSSGAFASYRTKNALPKKGWCSHRILALELVWDGGQGGSPSPIIWNLDHCLRWEAPPALNSVYVWGQCQGSSCVVKKDAKGRQGPQGDVTHEVSLPPPKKLPGSVLLVAPASGPWNRKTGIVIPSAGSDDHKFCFKICSLQRHHQQKGSRGRKVVKSTPLLYHQEQLMGEVCLKLPNCSFSLILLWIILFIAGNK